MRLYVMRHGKAEDVPTHGSGDAARALTEGGLHEMWAAGRGLAAMGITVDVIVTSPLVRARQTAEAVAAALLPGGAGVRVMEPLAGGFTVGELPAVLCALEPASAVLLVGHEPDMSELIGQLIAPAGTDLGRMARVTMKRGACCSLEVHIPDAGRDVPWQGSASLRWLLTARQLAALGAGR